MFTDRYPIIFISPTAGLKNAPNAIEFSGRAVIPAGHWREFKNSFKNYKIGPNFEAVSIR
jgi:hypothetical protein